MNEMGIECDTKKCGFFFILYHWISFWDHELNVVHDNFKHGTMVPCLKLLMETDLVFLGAPLTDGSMISSMEINTIFYWYHHDWIICPHRRSPTLHISSNVWLELVRNNTCS